MPIRVLPDQLAAQIAAGEVIERPSSVVKELIENALDAGATMVGVEVRDGGKRLLRVVDNGAGIPASEVELAFVHHATSKLASVDDLFTINTLGFRGEALPSIAAVSHVTMLTQAMGEQIGTEIKIVAGHMTSREGHSAPQGTVVTVENLFHNTPARLKFLRSTATEASHIHELVNRYALAYTSVRFRLTIEGRLVFQTGGTGNMEEVLIAVYGIDAARQMIALIANMPERATSGETDASREGSAAQTHATGFISRPSLTRANRSHMTFFVNGRAVQDRSLAFAVTEAYHTFLTVGRYPVSIIMIRVPPEEVDVNVHPTKAEVRFRDPHKVFSVVQRIVRATLLSTGEAPNLANPQLLTVDFDRQHLLRGLGGGVESYQDVSTIQNRGYQLDFERTTNDNQRQETLPQNGELRHETTSGTIGSNPAPNLEPSVAGRSPLAGLPMLRVLGQVARTYIIAEGPEGIFLIDQHAAHERVLYERLARQRLSATGSVGGSQVLRDPLTINLTPRQHARLVEQLDLFHSVGFALEPFGATTVLIRAVPDILADGDPRTALNRILDEMADEREGRLDEHSNPVGSLREQALIASVCKQSAIKGGRLLTMPEMQELIQQLERCESPRTCPHGRPTVVRLGFEQLAREFRRT